MLAEIKHRKSQVPSYTTLGAVCMKEGWVRIMHRRHRCDLSLFQLGMRLLEHFLNEDLPIPVAFHIFIEKSKSVR